MSHRFSFSSSFFFLFFLLLAQNTHFHIWWTFQHLFDVLKVYNRFAESFMRHKIHAHTNQTNHFQLESSICVCLLWVPFSVLFERKTEKNINLDFSRWKAISFSILYRGRKFFFSRAQKVYFYFFRLENSLITLLNNNYQKTTTNHFYGSETEKTVNLNSPKWHKFQPFLQFFCWKFIAWTGLNTFFKCENEQKETWKMSNQIK